MKKIMSLAIIILAAIILQSCHKINGEGPTVSQTYTLTDFSALDANIDADVYYTQDSFYSVEIRAQRNILELIQTPVINGELKIQYEKYKSVWNHDRISIYVTSPFLTNMQVSGSGSLRVLQPLRVNNLNLKVAGSGSINIEHYTGSVLSSSISGSGYIHISGGSVTTEALQISGSGTIDFLNMAANNTSADISGSGSASVRTSDNLDVHISGSGNLFYIGNPSVHTVISGSGRVTHM